MMSKIHHDAQNPPESPVGFSDALRGPRLSAYRDFHLFSLFRFPLTLPVLGVNASLVQRGIVDTVFGDWVMDFPFPFLYSCSR